MQIGPNICILLEIIGSRSVSRELFVRIIGAFITPGDSTRQLLTAHMPNALVVAWDKSD